MAAVNAATEPVSIREIRRGTLTEYYYDYDGDGRIDMVETPHRGGYTAEWRDGRGGRERLVFNKVGYVWTEIHQRLEGTTWITLAIRRSSPAAGSRVRQELTRFRLDGSPISSRRLFDGRQFHLAAEIFAGTCHVAELDSRANLEADLAAIQSALRGGTIGNLVEFHSCTERVQRALNDALASGLTCLAATGPAGRLRAARLATIIRNSSDIVGRKLSFDCTSEAVAELDEADAVASSSFTCADDWPVVHVRNDLRAKTGRASDSEFPSVIFHELIHLTGDAHGGEVDGTYACETACFAERFSASAEAIAAKSQARQYCGGVMADGTPVQADAAYFEFFRSSVRARGQYWDARDIYMRGMRLNASEDTARQYLQFVLDEATARGINIMEALRPEDALFLAAFHPLSPTSSATRPAEGMADLLVDNTHMLTRTQATDLRAVAASIRTGTDRSASLLKLDAIMDTLARAGAEADETEGMATLRMGLIRGVLEMEMSLCSRGSAEDAAFRSQCEASLAGKGM